MKKYRKLITIISLLIVTSLLLTACEGDTQSTVNGQQPNVSGDFETGLELVDTTRLSFGTASIGGVSYVFGSTLSQIYNNGVNKLEISPEVTGGPVVNIGLLQSGQIDIGHVTDSTSYEAYYGTEWATGDASPDIRALYPTYPSAFQAFAIEGNGINEFSDLDGKIVGYGPAGSSGDVVGHNVFKVLGITPKSDSLLGWSDTIGNMKDGMINGAVDVGGYPHTSRQELEATDTITWLRLTKDELVEIQSAYPYYISGTIPGGTYKHMSEDYETLFIWNEVICNKGMSDELAYILTKSAFELQPKVAEGHVGGKTMLPENVSAINIPLHPGAIKYYEEVGIGLEDWHYPDDYQR